MHRVCIFCEMNLPALIKHFDPLSITQISRNLLYSIFIDYFYDFISIYHTQDLLLLTKKNHLIFCVSQI